MVTGARQIGKSTLAEQLVAGDRSYRTLDDFDVLAAARRDPEALVGGHEPITLDEVQREPSRLTGSPSGHSPAVSSWGRERRPLAQRGGFPTPAIELSNAAERAIWFDGYVRTYRPMP